MDPEGAKTRQTTGRTKNTRSIKNKFSVEVQAGLFYWP